jgi:hypothetical protein
MYNLRPVSDFIDPSSGRCGPYYVYPNQITKTCYNICMSILYPNKITKMCNNIRIYCYTCLEFDLDIYGPNLPDDGFMKSETDRRLYMSNT